MISTTELILIAHDRLKDAETLLNAQRFDGAVYLCGYAIEIALKYKICKTLNWHAFPSSNKDFENYKSLKTHDLDVLLSFTGIETEIKSKYLSEWSAIKLWNPDARYNPGGTVSESDANLMVKGVATILGVL